MILILAGTRDGRELAVSLQAAGHDVLLSVVSDYGSELARQTGLEVQAAALDQAGLQALIAERGIGLLIDATHPYAANVSRNAAAAGSQAGIPVLRYERPGAALPDYEQLYWAADMAEAAAKAVSLGKNIFLTVGSHSLPVFRLAAHGRECRLIARVLPQPDVIAACIANGFSPADIVALQGPFSQTLNRALLEHYGADVLVTKESGTVGGTESKIAAAIELALPIVIVSRPPVEYGQTFRSIPVLLDFLKGSAR